MKVQVKWMKVNQMSTTTTSEKHYVQLMQCRQLQTPVIVANTHSLKLPVLTARLTMTVTQRVQLNPKLLMKELRPL